MTTAAIARDVGMQRALESCERESPKWGDVALSYLVSYARDNLEFLAEDVVAYAESRGLTVPQPKAFGSIFVRAAKAGIVKKIGYAPSAKRHMSPTVQWQSLVYWSAQ